MSIASCQPAVLLPVELEASVDVAGTSKQLIAVDGLCPRIAELLPGALHGLIHLGVERSPLAALTAELRQGRPIDTLHLVAHGRAGAIQLGGQWIDAASLVAHAADLAQWNLARIALWSCEVGVDSGFVALLSELTGAEVWASDQRLGAVAGSSHWSLASGSSRAAAPAAPFQAALLQAWPYQLTSYQFGEAYQVTNVADKETNYHTFDTTKPLGSVTIDDGTGGQKFSGNDVSATAFNVGGNTYYAWISRPIKIQGKVVGFYAWTDNDFDSLAKAQADGNADADATPADNKGFVLVVAGYGVNDPLPNGGANSPFASGGIGSSSDRVDAALNSLLPPANTAPVATADVSNLSATAGTPGGPALEAGNLAGANANGNVLINDTDADVGDSKRVSQIGTTSASISVAAGSTSTSQATTVTGSYGTLTIGADGTYVYKIDDANPAVDALRSAADTLTDVFTYTMVDKAGVPSTTTLSIIVQGGNDAPTANDDYNSAKESLLPQSDPNQYLPLKDPLGATAAGNVLANDTDVDSGDTKLVKQVSTSGSAVALQGQSTGSSVTTLSFQALNSSVKEGFFVFLDNGKVPVVDAANNHLTVASIDPVAKTFTLSGDIAPSLSFSSSSEVFGFAKNNAATSNYKTSQISGATSVSTSTIQLSVAAGDVQGTIAVGMTVQSGTALAAKVLAIGYDANGNINQITIDQPLPPLAVPIGLTFTGLFAAGQTINGTYGSLVLNADGTYLYTPYAQNPALADGESAEDRFIYEICDQDKVVSSADLVITVYGSSASDPNAVADFALAAREAGGVSNLTPGADSAGNVLTNDANGPNTVTAAGTLSDAALTPVNQSGVLIQGLYGTLTINEFGQYNYQVDNANPQVQALNLGGSLTEVFRYEISNGNVDAGGNLLKDISTLSIVINGANDAPFVLDEFATATEAGGSAAAPVAGFNPSGNVLANDTDVDNTRAQLTVAAVRTGASEGAGSPGVLGTPLQGLYGTLTLKADGSWDYVVDQSNPVVNALKPGQTLTDSFNYVVKDPAGLQDGGVLNIAVKGAADAVDVSSIFVNEASPYGVFEVTGQPGLPVQLALGNNGPATDKQAALTGSEADIQSSLEYYDPTFNNNTGSWLPYTAPNAVSIPAAGVLLVRMAINQDKRPEGSETLTLSATTADGSAAIGLATINDQGEGDIYLATNKTGTPNQNTDPGYPARLDDDRVMTVTSPTVNEGSQFAVFTVTGVSGQLAYLALRDASGDGGTDPAGNKADLRTGNPTKLPAIEYYDGITWKTYDPANPPTLLPDGTLPVRVDISAEQEKAVDGPETFLLDVTNTGGTTVTATATINDAGLGSKWDFTGTDPKGVEQPNPGPGGLPGFDDDRELKVDSPTVNEGSQYAVFTVSGAAGQLALLALRDASGDGGADPAGNKADLRDANTAQLPAIEYYDGTTWKTYDPTNPPALLPDGKLLVRVDISAEQEQAVDGPETFLLDVTNTGGTTVTSTATINDEGLGSRWDFTVDPKGVETPNPGPARNPGVDDDRTLSVNSPTVNEGSQYAVFTVSGAAGQLAFLALRDASGDGGADPAGNKADLRDGNTSQLPAIEYYDGTTWKTYDPTNPPALLPDGKLLVRVDISAEQEKAVDGPETFLLDVTNTGGTTVTSTATINDEGLGSQWDFVANPKGLEKPNPGPGGLPGFDDDSALTVDSPTVNEGSEYAVFEVKGASGQLALLALKDASGDGGTDTPGNNADLRDKSGQLPTIEYYDGTVWKSYDPALPPAILPSGTLSVRVKISAEQEKALDGPETFKLEVTNTGGTTVTSTATINDVGLGDKWDFSAPNGDPSKNPGQRLTNNNPAGAPGFDDDRTPTKLNLDSGTDSGQVGDRITANGLPQLHIVGVAGRSGQLLLKGPAGETLKAGTNYKVREVSLQDKPGQAVYVVDLIDADLSRPGAQSYGTYYQGVGTRNGRNSVDGTYRVFYNDDTATPPEIGSFQIRTSPLAQAARQSCLSAIFGRVDNRTMESTLYGHRTAKPSGSNGDDNLLGRNTSSDRLTGLNGSDLLNGNGLSRLAGAVFNPTADKDQIDVLTGGAGRDYFQLGDTAGSYYVNGQQKDHAVIADFGRDDCLIMHGSLASYVFNRVGNGPVEVSLNGDLVATISGSGIGALTANPPSSSNFAWL